MFLSLTDHFLIRASAALEKLKLLCGEDKECSNPSNLLELYTQVQKHVISDMLEGPVYLRGLTPEFRCNEINLLSI